MRHCCNDDPAFFLGKETKRMAVLEIRVLVFFTTLQESLRIQKDSTLGIMDKDSSSYYLQISAALSE